LRRKFQEDFEVLKGDLNVMSQSLKNIVLLLEELVQDFQTSASFQRILLALKIISQAFVIFANLPLAMVTSPCLCLACSIYKNYSLEKLKEIEEGVLQNLVKFSEVADSSPMKQLLQDFTSLTTSLSYKKLLKEKKLWKIPCVLETLSPQEILRSNFSLEDSEEPQQDKSSLDSVGKEFGWSAQKKRKITKYISYIQEKILLLDDFIRDAKNI